MRKTRGGHACRWRGGHYLPDPATPASAAAAARTVNVTSWSVLTGDNWWRERRRLVASIEVTMTSAAGTPSAAATAAASLVLA